MEQKKEVGRLAFRVEGDNWNAYFAKQDTMAGAIFMGSIPTPPRPPLQKRKREEQFLWRSMRKWTRR